MQIVINFGYWTLTCTSLYSLQNAHLEYSSPHDITDKGGGCSSHFWNTSSVDCGRILVLQYFSISSLPTAVVAVFGGGGGVERGETTPGGRTNCNVGGTAAAKTSVNCSGAMRVAMSAMPRAAFE